MECPSCHFQSQTPAVRCPACETFFPTRELEELAHVEYVLERVQHWQQSGLISAESARLLIAENQAQRAALSRVVLPEPKPETATPIRDSVTANPVTETVPESASVPVAQPLAADLKPRPADALIEAAPEPPRPAIKAPASRQISWAHIGNTLLSERTLNGLLGLGAFMILAAGLVISTLNPTHIAPLPHVAVVAITTLLFFAGGYLTRVKLRLVRVGAALLAIGAAFIPLLLSTIGQPQLLNWSAEAVWMMASLLTLPIYLGSHLVLRDRTFAVLTAIAAGSELLSVLHWLGVPAEWACLPLLVLLLGYVRLSSRLRETRPELAWALFGSTQVALPIVLIGLMACKLDASFWEALVQRPPSNTFEYAVGLAWWLGVVVYVASGRARGQWRYHFLAAYTAAFAYLLTLTKAPFSADWFNLALAVLALSYLLIDLRGRRGAQERRALSPREFTTRPLPQAAVVISLVALISEPSSLESRAATALVLGLVYAVATNGYQMRLWAYVSVAFMPSFVALVLESLDIDSVNRTLIWAALSGLLLCLAEVRSRRAGEARRPLLVTIFGLQQARSRFASPLYIACYGMSLFVAARAGADYLDSPPVPVGHLAQPATVLALALVVLVWGGSTIARRASAFLYPSALLLLPLITWAAHEIAKSWSGSSLSEPNIARVLAALGVAYLLSAWGLERFGGTYALPVYLVGRLNTLLSVLLASLDRPALVQVLAIAIGTVGWSAWMVHTGRHRTFLSIARFVASDAHSIPYLALRAAFLSLALWLFPGWLLLALSLLTPSPSLGGYGLMLTVLAPAYVALGELSQRIRAEYRWPWRLGGYALSIIGPMLASPEFLPRTLAMAVSMVLYGLSAWRFRQSAWLYAVAFPGALWVWQIGNERGLSAQGWSVLLPIIGLIYSLIGLTVQRLTGPDRPFQPLTAYFRDEPIVRQIHRFGLPFVLGGMLLTALGLAVAVSQELPWVVVAFVLGAIQAALWAVLLHEPLFSWCIAATLAIAYVTSLRVWDVPAAAHGLTLIPGTIVALTIGELLRRRVDPSGHDLTRPVLGGLTICSWAAPFYALAAIWSIAIPAFSTADQTSWAESWWAVMMIYGAVTRSFRHDAWLFPSLGAGSAALLASVYALRPDITHPVAFSSLIIPAALATGVALWVESRLAQRTPAEGVTPRLKQPWVRALLMVGGLSGVFALVGSVPDAQAGALTSTVSFLLGVGLVLRWRGELDAGLTLALLGVAIEQWLRVRQVSASDQPLIWSMIALILTAAAIVLRRLPGPVARLWRHPTWMASCVVAGCAVIGSVLVLIAATDRSHLPQVALTTAVTGLILVAHGFDQRLRFLHYLGVGLVELAYFIQLLFLEIHPPQAFAIPSGVYLLTIAYLEWRRGSPTRIRIGLEWGGLAILLITPVFQALGFYNDGQSRLVYDTFFLLESVGVFAGGIVLRWRRSFLAGIVATIVSVLVLLADPLRALETWYLVGLIGLTMVGAVIFIEKRRQQIPDWLDQWRARLERWD